MIAQKFQDRVNSLSTAASAFASAHSRLGEQINGGVAASMNKWTEHENRIAKLFNPERSALGEKIF